MRYLALSLLIPFVIKANAATQVVEENSWKIELGFGALASQPVFTEADNILIALPYFGATYERWSFGPKYGLARYRLTPQNAEVQIYTGIGMRDETYDSVYTPKSMRSDAPVFEGYESGETEITFTSSLEWKRITLSVEQDISNRSQGTGVSLNFDYPLPVPKQYGYSTLGIGMSWLSDEYVDYVYGVDENNVDTLVGRTYYQGKSSSNYYAYVQHVYPLNQKWSLVGKLQYQTLDDGIVNSPLVERDHLFSASLFCNYRWR